MRNPRKGEMGGSMSKEKLTREELERASAAWKRNTGLNIDPERIESHIEQMEVSDPGVVDRWLEWIAEGCPLPLSDDAKLREAQEEFIERFVSERVRGEGPDFPPLLDELKGLVLDPGDDRLDGISPRFQKWLIRDGKWLVRIADDKDLAPPPSGQITEEDWLSIPEADREAILKEARHWRQGSDGVWRRVVAPITTTEVCRHCNGKIVQRVWPDGRKDLCCSFCGRMHISVK